MFPFPADGMGCGPRSLEQAGAFLVREAAVVCLTYALGSFSCRSERQTCYHGRMHRGFPIALTADRTLMADYPTLLDGMMATVQTSAVPTVVMRRLLAPPVPSHGVRAVRAPLGLRRLEAALRRDGLGADDVVVVPPGQLHRAIGTSTRIVAVSSGDPLGLGMTSTTMGGLVGGRLHTAKAFEALCRRINAQRRTLPSVQLLAGGPGAWQLEQHPEQVQRLGIDQVVLGYADGGIGAPLNDSTANARRVTTPRACDIPPILGATCMGVVEISRGCGRGCGFCTLAAEPMDHLPVEIITADVATNVAHGTPAVSLVSEDFLRFGSPDTGVNPSALLELLQAVRSVPGVRMIQVDHVNVSSIIQFPPDALAEARKLIQVSPAHERIWVNVGVEAVDASLLVANGLSGKLHPFAAKEWSRLCREAVDRLLAAGFTPMLSFIVGLPGETPEHVRRTRDWVASLAPEAPIVTFPIFFAPVEPGQRAFTRADMTAEHWDLFAVCYERNFRHIPGMFADNHRAAGAPAWRRWFIQSAGGAQTWQWRCRFARGRRETTR